MGAPAHSQVLENAAKVRRYGRDPRSVLLKRRDFQGEVGFSKNRGVAPSVEKCDFPREKCDRYGPTPLKQRGFSLERSETMSKLSETPRKNAESARQTDHSGCKPVFAGG